MKKEIQDGATKRLGRRYITCLPEFPSMDSTKQWPSVATDRSESEFLIWCQAPDLQVGQIFCRGKMKIMQASAHVERRSANSTIDFVRHLCYLPIAKQLKPNPHRRIDSPGVQYGVPQIPPFNPNLCISLTLLSANVRLFIILTELITF